jgi:hypothetical protein
MDISQLISHPLEFIHSLSRVSDTLPDLGLHSLLEPLTDDPTFLSQIPFINSAADFQTYPSGTFLRFRCLFHIQRDQELVALRFTIGSDAYTGIVPDQFPDESRLVNPTLVERSIIHVSTLFGLSNWIGESESPIQAIVKILIEIPDVPFRVYDMFGFFLDPDPFTSPGASRDRFFYRSLPTFLAFSFVPVDSLYAPVLSFVPDVSEVRQSLLNFLGLVFQPLQAELLLLWMVGRRRRENPIGGVMGLISLAFSGCTPESISAVAEIIGALCTAVSVLPVESMSLRPRHTSDEFQMSPLILPSGTRILVDESRVDVASDDFLVLQTLISDQRIDAVVGGPLYSLEASFPVLVLSSGPTQFHTSVEVDIGEVAVGIELPIEENVISVLRYYVETVRYRNWELGLEAGAFVMKQVTECMASLGLTSHRLRLLLDLSELIGVSMAEEDLSPETWNHAMELVMKTAELTG